MNDYFKNLKVGDEITYIPVSFEYPLRRKGQRYTDRIEELREHTSSIGPYIIVNNHAGFWPYQIKIITKSDSFNNLYEKLLSE